jgi:hypothetical protein
LNSVQGKNEILQKSYLNQILEYKKASFQGFKEKKKWKTIENLNKILRLVLLAKDVSFLQRMHMMIGQIAKFYKEHDLALFNFRKLVI